jgi:hypothetical protein
LVVYDPECCLILVGELTLLDAKRNAMLGADVIAVMAVNDCVIPNDEGITTTLLFQRFL